MRESVLDSRENGSPCLFLRRAFLPLVFCLISLPFRLEGQVQSETPTITFQGAGVTETEINLLNILELETRVRKDLEEKKELFSESSDELYREQLNREIIDLDRKLRDIDQSMAQVAVGRELEVEDRYGSSEIFSWSNELKELLSPLLKELKNLTKRPREISQLRDETARYSRQSAQNKSVVEKLNQLSTSTSERTLKRRLEALSQEWSERQVAIDAQLAISEEKLSQKLENRGSAREVITNFSSLFFESRAKSLFIATIVGILVFLVFRNIPKLVFRFLGKTQTQLGQAGKVFQVLFLPLSSVFGTLSFLGVLYFFEDWILLLVFSLLLFGLIWTLKDTLPLIWKQMALILNLGPVREGERVEIEGIAYVVKSLGVFCKLANYRLSSGQILSLPIHDLIDLRSRKFSSEEKLFPTKVGDYVVFHGDKYGRVISQSPDHVQLLGFGKSEYFIPSTEFLAAQPRILSNGFGEIVRFGVDYKHQADATREIPKVLYNHLKSEFQRMKLEDQVENFSVEFDSAAESSLNIAIIAHFKGEAAGRYRSIPRVIQRACVEACNIHGWEIPFNQLVVHQAKGSY